MLVNNGLSDDTLYNVLRGIRESDSIRFISLAGNAFGEQCLLELSNILGRLAADKQLLELTLIRIKMSTGHLNSILEIMSNNCPLQKLGLSQVFFDEISIDLLTRILLRAKNLYSLNLGGCEILSIHVNKILAVISKNRKLEYLDLSWLPLGTQGEMGASSLRQEILGNILKFIRRDKQLLHLDLSYSRLTDLEFDAIIGVTIRSPSLMSLHADGNGITEACRKRSLERLKGIKIEAEYNELDEMITLDPLLEEKRAKNKMITDQKYIIWKIRGTPEIYLNNTWIESNDCFICKKWRYSVLLYSDELASKRFKDAYDLPSCNLLYKCY